MHSGKAAGPSLQGPGATERGTCVTSTAGSHRDFKGGNIGVCCEAPSGGGLLKEQNVWAVQRAGALSANLDRDEATALQKAVPMPPTSRLLAWWRESAAPDSEALWLWPARLLCPRDSPGRTWVATASSRGSSRPRDLTGGSSTQVGLYSESLGSPSLVLVQVLST